MLSLHTSREQLSDLRPPDIGNLKGLNHLQQLIRLTQIEEFSYLKHNQVEHKPLNISRPNIKKSLTFVDRSTKSIINLK